jgi:hypothetical protein
MKTLLRGVTAAMIGYVSMPAAHAGSVALLPAPVWGGQVSIYFGGATYVTGPGSYHEASSVAYSLAGTWPDGNCPADGLTCCYSSGTAEVTASRLPELCATTGETGTGADSAYAGAGLTYYAEVLDPQFIGAPGNSPIVTLDVTGSYSVSTQGAYLSLIVSQWAGALVMRDSSGDGEYSTPLTI